jgi:hypothetical protein
MKSITQISCKMPFFALPFSPPGFCQIFKEGFHKGAIGDVYLFTQESFLHKLLVENK